MWVLTTDSVGQVWTRHERLSRCGEEITEAKFFQTQEEAHDAAIELARANGALLRVMFHIEFVQRFSKELRQARKEFEERHTNSQYLPFDRPIRSKETGEKVGATLFLVVSQGYTLGVICQMKTGEVMSYLDEEYEYELLEEFEIGTEPFDSTPSLWKASLN